MSQNIILIMFVTRIHVIYSIIKTFYLYLKMKMLVNASKKSQKDAKSHKNKIIVFLRKTI